MNNLEKSNFKRCVRTMSSTIVDYMTGSMSAEELVDNLKVQVKYLEEWL